MVGDELGVSRLYARALFRLAVAHNEVDAIAQNLDEVSKTARTTPDLMTLLNHPRLPHERKHAILRDVFGTPREDVAHFLSLLLDKERIGILPSVAREFRRLVDEYRREADAEAVSAVELSETQVEAIRHKLEAESGYKLRLTTRVDPSILGGLVLRVGDRLIDGSVATRLSDLREQLRNAKVV